MSLNKAIAHGKEFRNPIHSCDSWCWNHGGCPYCLKNRVYQQRKETDKAESKLSEESLPSDCIRSFNRKIKDYGL